MARLTPIAIACAALAGTLRPPLNQLPPGSLDSTFFKTSEVPHFTTYVKYGGSLGTTPPIH